MQIITRCLGALLIGGATLGAWAQQVPIDVRISVPGPASSVSLPLELASRIGADTAEGLKLRLKFVGGGGVALQDMKTGDADYGVFGLPAAMLAHQKDDQYVALAAVEGVSVWVMMVRSGLRSKVRSVADLNGRIIGTHSSSLMAKTTGDVITRLVLTRHGVKPEAVQVTSAGQNWDTQSAALISNSVDAVMSDEPLATRMVREKIAFPIFNSGRPDDARNIPGLGFLRAALIGRKDRINADPQLAARLVKVIQRVLATMSRSTPEQIADWMGYGPGEERNTFIAVWKKYPRQYSDDAKFSTRQMRETELFVRASEPDNADIQKFSLDSMLMERWAGRKP